MADAHSSPGEPALRPVLEIVDVGKAVVVNVRPRLAPGQQATLMLVALERPNLSARLTDPVAQPSGTLEFALPRDLPPGAYVATIDVDGVASTPTMRNGRYTGPEVKIR